MPYPMYVIGVSTVRYSGVSARQKLTVLKITVKESVDNLSFPSMLLESQISPKPLAKLLILNFFPRDFFLSMRMTGYFDVT